MSLLLRAFRKSSPRAVRFLSKKPKKDDSRERLMFKLNGYYKYGLLHDDLLWETKPAVAEAIRRLPEKEQMQRIYRAIRAHQCDIRHEILPPEQWSKFEDNHYYLQPYVDEVVKEIEEREEWEANH